MTMWYTCGCKILEGCTVCLVNNSLCHHMRSWNIAWITLAYWRKRVVASSRWNNRLPRRTPLTTGERHVCLGSIKECLSCCDTGGTMATSLRKKLRHCWLTRDSMEATWSEHLTTHLETTFCLSGNTGVLTVSTIPLSFYINKHYKCV